jgi:hypothetical protein
MGPLLAAGEVKGQRLVVGAFSPQGAGGRARLPAVPHRRGNALLWLARADEDDEASGTARSGSLVEVDAGTTVRWWDADGAESREEAGDRRVVELDRVGFYAAGERAGAASLLSRRETQGRAAGAGPAAAATPAAAGGGGDLRPTLLWVLLALLLVEAWLFHRHGVA